MNIESWIKSFKKEQTKKDEFIIYLYDDGIKLIKTKYKKDGGIAKGIEIKSIFKYEKLLDENDKEIIKLLDNGLEGEIGGFLLKKLCKSGKFFNKEYVPFECQNKSLEIKLTDKIELNIKDVLPTNPVVEIDENKVYFLDTNLTYEEIKNLLNSPKITDKNIIKIYRFLKNELNLDIAPPPNYEIKEIAPIPKPKLTLQANKYIQLSFLYDKYEIRPYRRDEITIKETLNGEVRIKRNLELEENVIKEIESYGFKDLENTFIAEDLLSWKRFLENIDELKKIYIIEFDNFDMEFSDNSEISVESDKTNWFSLAFEVKIGKKKYPLLPIIVPILQKITSLDELKEEITVEYDKYKYITFKTKEIKPILKTIFELIDKVNGNNLEVAPYEAHLLDFDEDVKWKGKKELLKLSKQLKNFEGIKEVTPPKGLTVELRDYQKFGLNWLMFLRDFHFGGILADDMGLGKTIQTLALLLKLKESRKLKKPVLIIMPTSLLGNWKVEVEKFTPKLKYISIYGSDRGSKFRQIDKYDLVFTTYNLIVRDFEVYQNKEFEYIILDEAQKMKNPRSKSTQIIKELKSEYKLALSGTPIENHLGELWSIFSFVMPGFLGSYKFFRQQYQIPIENGDTELKEVLHKRVNPFILRRTKEKVATELPEKVEIVKYTEFSESEAKLYESIRVIMEKKVRDAITANGLAKSQILVLDALLKLRQVCCHPSLLKIEEAKKVKEAAKLELFLDLVEELISEGRKILVFSQFTSMLSIIEEEFKKLDIKYTKLTGSTKNRDKVIEDFKTKDIPIFLISLKAGGVGLNLTEADTIIHYDPWWNKAAQNQATDRAYRIGQKKNVFVYKLVVRNTIEEKIIALQNKKEKLAEIFEGGEVKSDELLELLK